MLFSVHVHYLQRLSLNWVPGRPKVSRLLIANMIPLVNISKKTKWKNIYVVAFRVSHWDTLDGSLAFKYARGRYFLAY